MGNACILHENKADDGVVTATTALASAPAARVQNRHVRRRWKGRGGPSESLLLDLGADESVDTIALFGIAGVFGGTERNFSEVATSRVRCSSADPTGAAGEDYDGGSAAGRIKLAYGSLVVPLPAPVTTRYVLIDLSEAGCDGVMAGRLVVGLRNEFIYGFSYNWSFGYADLSRKRRAAGGQTFVDRDDRYRVLSLDFGAMDPADRYGFVDDMDRLNGASEDILFIIDPDSTDITRDTIWGLAPELTRPTQPYPDLFAKGLSIEERL